MDENYIMKNFEDIAVMVREEVGYTLQDAKKIYEIATQYAHNIFSHKKIISAYLIGSYAAGTFTPNRSDIDFVAFYEGKEVIFFETPLPISICDSTIQREINVSICCRPIEWIEYWNTVPQRLMDGIIWKEVNAYEDYMMLLNHGIHVFGVDLRDNLIELNKDFKDYLYLRNTISASICKTEKIYPNLLNVAKTIISLSRDAIFVWTGQYYYSIYACFDIFTKFEIEDEAVSILKDAIDVVDQKWDEISRSQSFEVPLAKLIRKCIRFMNYLIQFDKKMGGKDNYYELLKNYTYIPYNFPPCENAFDRKVKAHVTGKDVTNIQLI